MKTDVLFIHRQISFAVSIKQALLRTNDYDVHPFTSVEAALEYLRGHRQGIALIDFSMPVFSGEEIIARLREIQPELPVIATPEQSVDELARLRIQATVGASFTGRDLIPVIEQALEGRRAPAKKTTGLLNRVVTQELPAAPPPATPDDRTWVEGLPTAQAAEPTAQDLFDLFPEFAKAPLDPQSASDSFEGSGATTERLGVIDPFGSDELPELEPLSDQEPGVQTERMAEDGDVASGAEGYGLGPEYGTRPLSEIEAEEAARRRGASLPQFETLEEALAASITPEEAFPPPSFGDAEPEFPSAFNAGVLDHENPFAVFEDEESSGQQGVDYLAGLNLEPTPSDAPPWLAAELPAEPEDVDEDVHARLEQLFSSEEPAPPPVEDEFSFDDLAQTVGEPGTGFTGLLGDIGAEDATDREPTAFDDLVASMSAPDERAPLTARQQQYVDVALTDDMTGLMEQFEQARTSGEPEASSRGAAPDFGPVDLSAVLFEDDEDGSDTPAAQATAFEEAPALASPEELEALFASPRSPEATQLESDFEALFAPQPAAPAAEPAPGDSSFTDADLESLFPTQIETTDADLESRAVFGTGPAEASMPEVDLESIFAQSDQPPAGTAILDMDDLYGGASEPAASGQDIFSGDWAAGDLVDLGEGPGFEETGTVSDLMTGVGDMTGSRSGMLNRLEGDLPPIAEFEAGRRPLPGAETAAAPPPIDDSVTALLAEIELQLAASPPPPLAELERSLPDDTSDTPARRILETTADTGQTDSSFSLNHFVENIEAQLPPNRAKVKPLPSWTRQPPSVPELEFEDETLAHTPPAQETVPHAAVPADADAVEPPFDWEAATFDDTTVMGEAARAEQVELTGDEETSWLDYIAPSPDAVETTESPMVQTAQTTAEPDQEAVDAGAETSAGPMQAEHIDDPYIAQLALSLTDVSLELTAEAVLLTRGRDIVAFAGQMSRDELLELRHVIDDDWEAAANDARIRFLRLPAAGKDVMLYSRRTVEDLTMSLVFDGAMPLRDIRQQGKRLMDALAAVPEAPAEEVVEAEPEFELPPVEEVEDGVPRSAHAYVWLVRDPNALLARPTAQAIAAGIHQQMRDQGWRVRELRASDDHVYMLAEAPDEQPPYVAVRELMRRSAQIAHAHNPAIDPATLWADAYLVVTPGRPLDQDEIQQFIQFERMV